METGVHKTAMPTVAGILSIVSGAFKLMLVMGMTVASFFIAVLPQDVTRLGVIILAAGVFLLIIGVLAIVGGAYTLQRKNYGLALTGAIAALLPFNLLGLASVILLALCRKEFES